MDRVGIVILNYNGWLDTTECVKSIVSTNIKIDYKIIIIDNNSNLEDKDHLLNIQKKYDCELIFNENNLGYAAGNNVGIRHAINNGCNYICVLNNDTIIENDFFSECVKYLKNNLDVAFIGPVILNYKDEYIQSTGGNVSLITGTNSIINMNVHRSKVNDLIECDYVGGACIVAKSSHILDYGYIPESYFLFFEENEWCLNAKRKGYRNVILPNCTIRHKGSVSIKKTKGLSEYMYERNLALFVKRNCKCKFEFVIFIFIHSLVILKRALRHGPAYLRQFSYMKDGIKEKVSSKFPFIYINSEVTLDENG